MFVDTDTVDSVRSLVADALLRKVNSVRSDINANRRGHTSIVPQSQIRRKARELAGVLDVYFAVFHSGDAEGFDQALVDAAQETKFVGLKFKNSR